MDILQAVVQLRPGTSWNLNGDTLTQALDGTKRVTPPTMDEINAVLLANSYKELRAKEYPLIADQLDALWKGGQAQLDMKAQIDSVKAKYPKETLVSLDATAIVEADSTTLLP